MRLHGNARTCLHSRRLIVRRVLEEGWSLAGRVASRLDAVGYGIQQFKPVVIQDKIRMLATPEIASLDQKRKGGFIVATTTRANNGGGTCFGDSGGPMLLPGSDQIAAVVSFGQNGVCKSFDYSYRVDTLEAQAFVTSFVITQDRLSRWNIVSSCRRATSAGVVALEIRLLLCSSLFVVE